MSETSEKTPESNICEQCGCILDLGRAVTESMQTGKLSGELKLCPGHPKKVMHMSYTADGIGFTCANCGTTCTLMKRSGTTELSGTFCPTCDEQYYTRWDGVLHRGKILTKEEEAHEQTP